MNKSINQAFRKTKAGNYFGYYYGHYVFTYRRPHGKWCCNIGKGGKWLHGEGYSGTYLRTLQKAKQWVQERIRLPSRESPALHLVVQNHQLKWSDGTPAKVVEANSPENSINLI